ncbi:MAG: trigger factor [Candidatus Saccharimonadales bacterium]
MQVTTENLSPTKFKLAITGDGEQLLAAKQQALQNLASSVNIAGFRAGKAPLNLVEKNADPEGLNREFLDAAVNNLYVAAITGEKLRPVEQPQVEVSKFVPFSALEIKVEVEALAQIKVPDYKNLNLQREAVKVLAEDISKVLAQLQVREADKKSVSRPAKNGDQVIIDFEGKDALSKQPINGGSAQDYPLMLGSKDFIPGFEPELVGAKASEDRTFTLTFPKDYGVASLQNKQITFEVKLKKVQELKQPKLDDAFAAKVGPFKNLAELKADIKKQLQAEQAKAVQQKFEEAIIDKLAAGTKITIPEALIKEQLEQNEATERQNLSYRGQTWQEHLTAENLSEAQHRAQHRPEAETQVKGGLALSAVAEAEGLDITNDELEARIKLLKGQYSDASMQAELDKPENRREIFGRLLTEKTIAKLTEFNSAK